MYLKYYAEVPNVVEAIEYYSNVFDVNVIKDGSEGHGNIKLFNQISLLLHSSGQQSRKPGYYIIRFEDGEQKLYDKAVKKVKESNLVSIGFDEYKARWGTTFFEFTDKYGYTWDLEVKK